MSIPKLHLVRGETDKLTHNSHSLVHTVNRRLYRVQQYLEENTVKSLGDDREQFL